MASWAAVKAPTPAKVAWHNESWPAMPVISVIDSSTIDNVKPLLKTVVQAGKEPGIQVSMDTQKPAKRTHHSTRMMRSMRRSPRRRGHGRWRRVDRGQWVPARVQLRMPGRNSRATTIKMNGRDGTTAALKKLSGGM